MKAIKRHLATVLAAIMIFTTIGNAYVSAKASGDTLDTFGEDAGTHEITVTDQGEAVPPAEVTETAPPEETAPPAPVVEETPVVIEETPVVTDTTPVEPELPPTDVQEPVITDQTDVPETETTDVPETEIVNEDYSVIVVNYDAGVGGTVDYPSESFRSDDTSIQLYGSQAMPESGYIFKNWIRTETNEVVSTDQLFVPDSEEVQWILGHTADAGGEINVSYTAQFVAVASEYEEILPNVIRVKILVSEGAFDREVELVVEELQSDTQQYIDAEQALIDAEVEYTGMMAFDIHFEDVETGEEIEPAGPVKMEYEILRRQINKTIDETDGLDEITSESQIQMHHMVETENAYTGEKELAVETIADSTLEADVTPQTDNLEDPTAGLDRDGFQETVTMGVTTDANDNVTGMSGDVVLNGFSIFTFTVNENNRAGTYEVPNVRIVKNNGEFNRATYQGADFIEGTAVFNTDGNKTQLVQLKTANGPVKFTKVYWVQGLRDHNAWPNNNPREVTDWNMTIRNNGSYLVRPKGPEIAATITMYESSNANNQWGGEYYFLTDDNIFGNGLAEGEIAAYVYKPGTGAGQITVNGKNYVPASPKVTAVTFSGARPTLKDFRSYESVWRKSDKGDGYGKVLSWNYTHSYEQGWISATTSDDNQAHRYIRKSSNQDSSHEYVWLLHDDGVMTFNANYMERVYKRWGQITVHYGNYGNKKQQEVVFTQGKADPVITGQNYAEVWYRDGKGGKDYTTRYIRVKNWEMENLGTDNARIVAVLDTVDDRGNASNIANNRVVFFDKNEDNSGEFFWLNKSSEYEKDMITTKVYMRYDNAVPAGNGFVNNADNLHAAVGKGKYGPAGNNTPYNYDTDWDTSTSTGRNDDRYYHEVQVDLGKVLQLGGRLFSWDEIPNERGQNNFQQYYTYMSSNWNGEGAAAGAGSIPLAQEFFLSVIYQAMEQEGRDFINKKFGTFKPEALSENLRALFPDGYVPNYVGYVLKWEKVTGYTGDDYWHIDGAIAAKPSFMVELYTGMPDAKGRSLIDTMPSLKPRYYYTPDGVTPDEQTVVERFNQEFMENPKFLADEDSIHWDDPTKFVKNGNTFDMTGTFVDKDGKIKKFTVSRETSTNTAPSYIVQNDTETIQGIDPAKMQYYKGNVKYHPVTEGVFYLAIYSVRYEDVPSGNLEITKVVDDKTASGQFKNQTYRFQVLDKNGEPIHFNIVNGRHTFTAKTDAPTEAEIVITNGQSKSVTIYGVPTGTYTVVETYPTVAQVEADNKNLKMEVTYEPEVDGKVDIRANETATATVVNTFTDKKGTLKFEKVFEGVDDAFLRQYMMKGLTFTLYDINGKKVTTLKGKTWAGNIALDGTAYENLDAFKDIDPNDSRMGGAITFENVPAGRYYVVETGEEVDGYDLEKTINGKAFTTDGTEVVGAVTVDVTSNEGAVITIVNKYEGNRGGLTLKKTFTGDKQGITEAQKTTTFTIYKKVGNKEEVLTVGGKKYENIPYSELTNIDATSAKLELSGLDAADYWVVENGEDGTNQVLGTIFKITTSGDEGKGKMKTLTKNGNVSFEITNNYERKFVPVVGKKIWDDSDNIKNLRPQTIKVRVKAYVEGSDTPMTYINGVLATQYTETFTKTGNEWEIRFDGKYKYDETTGNGGLPEYTYPAGKKITYKLVEMDGNDELAEGGKLGEYTVSYSENGLEITNRYAEADRVGGGDKGKPNPGHEKYVDKVPNDANWDGTYDLTLTVQGMQGSSDNKAQLDILFITDFSGSMQENFSGQTRYAALKQAVRELVTQISSNEKLDAQFSIVGFNGTKKQYEYNHKDDDAKVVAGWTAIGKGDTAGINNFIGQIDKVYPYAGIDNTGTNYAAGLIVGANQMNVRNKESRPNAQTVIVFVSDGAPTYWYVNNGETDGTGGEEKYLNGPRDYDNMTSAYNAAITQVKGMTANHFYAVFVGDATQKVTGQYGYNTREVLENITKAAGDNVNGKADKPNSIGTYEANDMTKLQAAFKDIGDKVQQVELSNVEVKDTLSNYTEFVEGDAALKIEIWEGDTLIATSETVNGQPNGAKKANPRPDNNASLTFRDPDLNQNVTLNLTRGAKNYTLKFNPTTYKLNPKYSYRITAHVEPTQAAYQDYANRGHYPEDMSGDPGTHAHAGTTGYFSNNNNIGSTYLKYTYDGKTYTDNYPKPVVRLRTMDINLKKLWVNAENNLIPGYVTIELDSENAAATVKDPITLSQPNWAGSFTGLRAYKSGEKIAYTIKEQGATDDNKITFTVNDNDVTYEIDYGTLTFKEKVTADGNEKEIYEQTITNTMLKGGLTLTKNIGYDESGAEKFTDEDKNTIRKALEDKLTFEIFRNGNPLRTVQFSEMDGEGDTRTFNLQDAEPGQYYVEEYRDGAKVASYELTVSGDDGRASQKRLSSGGSVSFTITNTYKKIVEQEFKPADLTIHKVDDQGNLITGGVARFRLNRNGGEEKQTDGGVVKFTFDENDYKHLINANDPTNIANASVTYVLTEVQAPAGYQRAQSTWQVTVKADSVEFVQVNGVWKYVYTTKVEVNGNFNAETGTLTAINPKLRDITVKKEWLDNNNNDGVRPANAWVRLFANEVATDNVVDLEAQPNRTYIWKDLKQYDDEGQEIAYTVRELWQQSGRTGIEPDANGILWLKDSEGNLTYRVTYSGDMEQGFTVTNARGDDKVVVRVEKFWSDVDDQDGKRPAEVWARIKAEPASALNGVTTDIDLAKQTDLAYIWENLPARVDGVTVHYEVVELDGNREVGASSANKTLAGKDGAVYKVTFVPLQTTGEKMYSNTRIVNSYEPELIPVTVTKEWVDNNDQDGIRPATVSLALFKKTATGEELVRKAVTVRGTGNTWTHTFNNLPKYEGKQEITYIVREYDVDQKVEDNGTLSSKVTGKDYTAKYDGLKVTNTYQPKKINIPVKKIWEDNNNNDRVRPDSITVTLYGKADGDTVYEKTVTINKPAADTENTQKEWDYVFEGLDEKYQGSDIIYTMEEVPVAVSGYKKPEYSADHLTVTNPYSTTTTDVSGLKTWGDNYNQDGKRPAKIVIALTGKVGDTVVHGPIRREVTGDLTAASWSYSFTNLPKKSNGQDITYTIEEIEREELIEAGYGDPKYDESHQNVENPRDPEKTKIVVEKQWDDKNDQDGLRKAVNVRVYKVKDGGSVTNVNDLTPVGDIKQLGTTSGATVTFENLDVYEAGKKITYVAYELDAANQPIMNGGKLAVDYGKFYDVSYADKTPATGVSLHTVVTNKYTPEEIPVEITKIWDDKSDNDGVRPSVTLQLYKAVKDAAGQITGYTPVADTEVTLQKVNYADRDSWTYKYPQNFPKYEVIDGKGRNEITYVVRELNGGAVVDVNGKIPSTDASRSYTLTKYDGLSVTNALTPATIKKEGVKTWGDNKNNDGVRPSSITITLTGTVKLADGSEKVVYQETKTVEAPEGENTLETWNYSFENLPQYVERREVVYTLSEQQVPGYGKPEVTGMNVLNPYDKKTISVSGKKFWDDNYNQDGRRPEMIRLTLTGKVGEEVVHTETKEITNPSTDGTNKLAEWSYSFDNLPKMSGGKEIKYEVTEEAIDGYGEVIINGYDLKNPRTNDKVKVVIEKNWDDKGNQDNLREPVRIQLYKTDVNGAEVEVGSPKTLGIADNASVKIDDLDKYQGQGREIEYYARELDANGDPIAEGGMYKVFKVSYSEKELTDEETADKVVKYLVVTNSYEPVPTEITVTKIWEDNKNQDGVRPDSVRLALYKRTATGGEELVEGPVDVDGTGDHESLTPTDKGENWTYTFTGIQKNENGSPIVYFVREYNGDEVVEDGGELPSNGGYAPYKASYDGLTVTNTYTPELRGFDGVKTWDDNKNQDGERPTSITITLTGTAVVNGVEELAYERTRTFGGDMTADTWKFDFGNELPKFWKGEPITYTITEQQVSVAYGAPVYDEARQNVTNPYNPNTTDVTGRKIWGDNQNQDAVRPEKIEITLTGTIVKDGATKEAFAPVKFDVSVKSVYEWDAKAKAVKLVDGESETLAAGADNRLRTWSYEVRNLPKKAEGEDITYTVTETPLGIEGYGKPDVNGYDVENPYTTKKTKIVVEKNWEDNDNQDGLRQDVRVQLYKETANGIVEVSGKSAILGTQDGAKVTFEGLELNENGNAITYVVREMGAQGPIEDGGKLSVKREKEYDVTYDQDVNGENVTAAEAADGVTKHLIVTNRYTPELTHVVVTKNWLDNNDQDGVRPEEIYVELYANGVKVERDDNPERLHAGNTPVAYSQQWSKLPRYANGVEIEYTVKEGKLVNGVFVEGAPDGYKLISNVATKKTSTVEGESVYTDVAITNNHEFSKTNIVVEKNWNDDNNRDGLRTPVKVRLYKEAEDGTLTVASDIKTLGTKDGETVKFENLDTHENKKLIKYVVRELDGLNNPIEPDGKLTVLKDKQYDVTYDEKGLTQEEQAEEISKHLVVKNSYLPETINIPIEKIWMDTNYTDLRPKSVTVELVRKHGKALPAGFNAVKKLEEGNEWKGIWEGLHKYENTGAADQNNAVEIQYDIKEVDVPENYKSVKSGNQTIGFTVTNTFIEKPTQQPVIKIWEDAKDHDGIRPKNITVGLFANGELIKSQSISVNDKAVEGKEWSYIFTDLPLRDGNGVITYTVGEMVDGGNAQKAEDYIIDTGKYNVDYDTFVVGNEITNRHDHEIDKEVKKANGTWEGEIKLENNDEVFEYRFGTAIPDRKDLETFVITDDIHSEMTIVSTKEEIKATLPDAVRDAAEVDITGNTVKISWKFAEVDGNNNITYMNQDLKGLEVSAVVKAKFKNPNNIDLTADGVVAGKFPNTVRYNIDDEDDHWSNTVKVQPKQEETEVPVTKIWDDANDYDGIRPENITVGVFTPKEQGGTELVLAADAKTIKASNKDVNGKEWSYKFTGLVKNYPDGTAIPYTIGELVQNGDKDDMNDWILADGNLNADYQTFVDQTKREITNRHDPKIDKEVKGESQAETAYTKEDYALSKAGEKFDYRASTAIPATDRNGDPTTKFEITDTLTEALVFESKEADVVVKVAGAEVTGANRPAVAIDDATKTLTVTFEGDALANAIGKKVTVEFRASIDPKADLTQYVETMDGKIPNDVDYRINLDDPVPSEKVWVKPFSEKIDIPVVKVWEDANNYDNIRPSVITVGLFIGDTLQNTKQIQVTDTAVDGKAWSVKWEGLDKKYANSTEIPYNVKEQAADGAWIALSGNYNDGYKANVTGNKDDGYTITNTHDSKIEKDVNGKTDHELETPDEVFTYTVKTAITDKLDAKSFVITDTLEPVLEFVSKEDGVVTAEGFAIKLDVSPAAAKVEIDETTKTLKVTYDLADEDGDETNGVQNALKGQPVEIKFNAKVMENANLEPYSDGTIASNGKVPNKATYTIDNKFSQDSEPVHVRPKGDTVDVPVIKIWEDAEDYDGIRPTRIIVGVFKGDTFVDRKELTKDVAEVNGQPWSWIFTGLPKNELNGDVITYTIRELKASASTESKDPADWIAQTGTYNPDYETVVNNKDNTITNTHDHKIEKDVNGKTDHELEAPDEVFTYTVKTAITDKLDAKSFVITDTLEPVLEFVSKEDGVVTAEGLAIKLDVSPAAAKVEIDETTKTLKVTYDLADEDGDETNGVQNALKGQKVEIKFNAKVVENANLEPYSDGTIASNGKVPNKATYTIDNDFSQDSEPVHVRPKGDTVDIPVIKKWEDAENYDKVRPTTITVGVFKGDTFVEARDITIDKTEVNGQPWSVLFAGLPKNELNGDIIEYTVRELKAGVSRESRNPDDWITTGAYSTKEVTKEDGTTETVPVYEVTVTQNNDENVEEGFTVTNRHDHKIDKAVQKANGTWTGKIELEDNAETFSYQFKTAIPDRQTLKSFEIRDTLDELLVFENGNATNVVITPTAAAKEADVKIEGQNLTITWTFAEGQDPNVKYINQELKGTNLEITVNAKFANPDQIDMTKTVEGSVPNKVRYSIDGEPEKKSDDVWVTPKQNQIDIKVVKEWKNDEGKNIRPTAITIGLFRNDELRDQQTLTRNSKFVDGKEWSYIFKDLPLQDENGNAYVYVVKELIDNGDPDNMNHWIESGAFDDMYTAKITVGTEADDPDGSQGDKVREDIITNSAETNEITVRKVWDDDENRDNVRDTIVNVGLFRTIAGVEVDVDEPFQGIKQLRERTGWEYTWKNLPLSENGEKITYTVKEQRKSDAEWITTGEYNADYTLTSDQTADPRTLTNKHVPAQTEVSVEKKWDDFDNQDGVRPESIRVYVLADNGAVPDEKATYTYTELDENGRVVKDAEGNDVVKTETYWQTLTPDENGNWSYTWKGLPKFRKGEVGKEVVYTVRERELDGYETTYADGKNSTVITNKLLTTELTVTKKWEDENNQDGVRPDLGEVSVRLYKKGVDENNEEILIPVRENEEVKLNLGNNLTYTWKNLPQYEDQKEIEYVVREMNGEAQIEEGGKLPGKYEKEYTVTYGKDERGELITNTYEPEEVDVEVEKIWDDQDNKDKLRTPLEVKLFANGEEVKGEGIENPKTIDESTDWKASWTKLPKYVNGEQEAEHKPIVYTVEESGQHASYEHDPNAETDYRLVAKNEAGEVAADDDAIAKYEITLWNRYVPDETTYKIVKIWDDANNQDGFRDTVYVQLYADGEPAPVYDHYALVRDAEGNLTYDAQGRLVREAVAEQVETLVALPTPEDENSRVAHVWKGLPKYRTGTKTEIVYMAKEVLVKEENGTIVLDKALEDGDKLLNDEYEVSYSTSEEFGFEITNKHVPYTTEIKVGKVWGDANDADGIRPASIEIKLTGTTEGGYEKFYFETLNAEDKMVDGEEWTFIFNNNGEGLPVYHKGEKITYTVEEMEVPDGYAVRYGEIEGVKKIENAHNPKPKKEVEPTGETTDGKLADGMKGKVNDALTKAELAARNEIFTYRIKAAVPELVVKKDENGNTVEELTKFVITDELVEDLTFVSTEAQIDGKGGAVKIEGQKLTVTFEGAALDAVSGKEVVIEFKARFAVNANVQKYLELGTDGIPNEATATFYGPDDKPADEQKTEPVTVTPPDPEIEKEVQATGTVIDKNGRETTVDPKGVSDGTHAKLANRNEVFEYTVKTAIPERLIDSFVITDEVKPELEIVEIVGVTVGKKGAKDDERENYAVHGQPVGNTITVSFTDKNYLKAHAGDEVILTFTAKIEEGADISKYIVDGKKGVPNDASYEYKIGNEAKTKDSNEVTVEPPDPEIDKEVKADGKGLTNEAKTVAELAMRDETFTYTIRTTLPESQIEKFVIKDEIKPVLEFVGTKDDVRVNAEAVVEIKGQTLTVTFAKAYLNKNAGREVEISFRARVRDNATAAELAQYILPDKNGIENTATYKIDDKDEVKSEPVYVTPADPRIEKEVVNAKSESFLGNRKHADLASRNEVYPYTIFTEIPMRTDVVRFTVTDKLEDVLHYISTEADVEVTVDGKNAKADATVTIDTANRTLNVAFDGTYVEKHMGEEVVISFKVQINNGANLAKYLQEVDPYKGLYPAAPSTELERIPNEASYTIETENVARLAPRRDWVAQRDADASGKTITRKSDVVTVTPPEELNIRVVKTWDDQNNAQGRRPAEVRVTLWQNGAAMGDYTYIDEQGATQRVQTTVTLNEANQWTDASWVHLPKYVPGTKTLINYTVQEEVPEDYQPTYTTKATADGYEISVSNKYDPEKTHITVVKRWIDNDNRFGTRPASITAVLQADGKEAARVELNQANSFMHTWNDLDKFADGKEVTYTVVEAPVPEGYEVNISNARETTFVITNTVQTGTLVVNKVATGLPAGTNPTYTFVIRNATTGDQVANLRITGSGSGSVEVAPGSYIVEELGANESTVRNYTLVTTGSGQTVVVRRGVQTRADIVNRYTNETPPPTREVPPDTPINQNPPVEAPEVLGVRRTDSESVLGARRGKTGDKSGARNVIAMFAAGAAAMLLALTGRRKKKDGDEG